MEDSKFRIAFVSPDVHRIYPHERCMHETKEKNILGFLEFTMADIVQC